MHRLWIFDLVLDVPFLFFFYSGFISGLQAVKRGLTTRTIFLFQISNDSCPCTATYPLIKMSKTDQDNRTTVQEMMKGERQRRANVKSWFYSFLIPLRFSLAIAKGNLPWVDMTPCIVFTPAIDWEVNCVYAFANRIKNKNVYVCLLRILHMVYKQDCYCCI